MLRGFFGYPIKNQSTHTIFAAPRIFLPLRTFALKIHLLVMNRKLIPALLIGLALAAFACNTKESEPEKADFYGDFFVRYLVPEKELKAYASFSQGDSVQISKAVALEGGLTFQGSAMEAHDLQGQQIRYFYRAQADYKAPYTFKGKTPAGKDFEFTLNMSSIGKFSIKEGVISKSKGMTLVIENGTLTKEETVVMLFTNPADNKSYTIIDQGPYAGDEHNIPATALQSLPKGKLQLYLVKKQQQLIENATISSTASAEFYTDMIEVTVTD